VNDRWWHRAACAGMDPEDFSPLGGSINARTREVLRLCDRCPVRRECRDDMLEVRPLGPMSIVAGGWRFDVRGRPIPHPDDVGVAAELVAAAIARTNARGVPWPFQVQHKVNRFHGKGQPHE
jgi:hypothetical protein